MRLSILIVPAFLMACASIASQPSEPPSPAPSKAAQQNQGAAGGMQAEPQPRAASAKDAPPTPSQSPAQTPQPVVRRDADHVDHQPSPDWWARIAALLTVVATIIQVWILRRQSEIIDSQRRIAREGLHTSQTVERAWITISAMDIKMAPDTVTQVTFVWKNTGNTPAFMGSARVVIEALPKGRSLTVPPDYGGGESASPPAVLVSGEEASSVVPVSPKLSAQVYADVQSGALSLYVFGYVEYRTVFNKSRMNTYKFARRYSPELSLQHKRTMWYYPMEEGYNDAD